MGIQAKQMSNERDCYSRTDFIYSQPDYFGDRLYEDPNYYFVLCPFICGGVEVASRAKQF